MTKQRPVRHSTRAARGGQLGPLCRAQLQGAHRELPQKVFWENLSKIERRLVLTCAHCYQLNSYVRIHANPTSWLRK